tara:strand:- start:40 stop:1098 length:1059 start_codon:yes stop_codon:yes gene_type:complete
METDLDFSKLSKEEIIRFWNLLGHKSEEDRFCLSLIFDNEKCTCIDWERKRQVHDWGEGFDEDVMPLHVQELQDNFHLQDITTCVYCGNYFLGWGHGGWSGNDTLEFNGQHVWDMPKYQTEVQNNNDEWVYETEEEWLSRTRERCATRIIVTSDKYDKGSKGYCYHCKDKFDEEVKELAPVVNIDDVLIEAEGDRLLSLLKEYYDFDSDKQHSRNSDGKWIYGNKYFKERQKPYQELAEKNNTKWYESKERIEFYKKELVQREELLEFNPALLECVNKYQDHSKNWNSCFKNKQNVDTGDDVGTMICCEWWQEALSMCERTLMQEHVEIIANKGEKEHIRICGEINRKGVTQ